MSELEAVFANECSKCMYSIGDAGDTVHRYVDDITISMQVRSRSAMRHSMSVNLSCMLCRTSAHVEPPGTPSLSVITQTGV